MKTVTRLLTSGIQSTDDDHIYTRRLTQHHALIHYVTVFLTHYVLE